MFRCHFFYFCFLPFILSSFKLRGEVRLKMKSLFVTFLRCACLLRVCPRDVIAFPVPYSVHFPFPRSQHSWWYSHTQLRIS